MTGIEVTGDGDNIWPIWIFFADCGILPKECPVIIGDIEVWLLPEGYD